VKLGSGSLCKRKMESSTSALWCRILAEEVASMEAQSCLHNPLVVSHMVALEGTPMMCLMSVLLLLRQHEAKNTGI
jgi:hypothetical protein